jgi:uncharacterized protein YndB with AHSA1/START domain
MTKQTDDVNAVVIERTFNAPLALVWQMWTDANAFASWYGPVGASIPFAEFDVHVGGQRRLCMEVTTPQGPMRMWFGGEYRAVDAPTRLVYTEQITDEHGIASDDGHATEVRVELSEVADGTRVLMTHAGIPSDSPGAMGWQMAFDKLAAHLAS